MVEEKERYYDGLRYPLEEGAYRRAPGEKKEGVVRRTLKIILYAACHTAGAAAFIVAVGVLHILLGWFGDPKLFGVMPIAYLVDLMDLIVLLLFTGFVVREAIDVFRE